MALFLGVLALAFVHVFGKTKCYGSGGWGDLTIIWEHGAGPEKKHTVLIPELSGDALTPTETHVCCLYWYLRLAISLVVW